MSKADNTRAVAREISARIFDALADIDRYWHVELEGGLAKHRDWCGRHPESGVP